VWPFVAQCLFWGMAVTWVIILSGYVAWGSSLSVAAERDCDLQSPRNISVELRAVPWDGRHSVKANRKVTSTYLWHARWWQQTVDPNTNATSTGAWPTWFMFAPYASREVGRGLSLLTSLSERKVITGLQQASHVFNTKLIVDPRCGPLWICWGQIATMLKRLATVVLPAPKRALTTVINLLEHGNRLICEHICGASEQYVRWRRRLSWRAATPELVLADFRLQPSGFRTAGVRPSAEGTDPMAARQLFEAVANGLRGCHRDPRPLLVEHRCVDILVAAFAMWEAAGLAFRAQGASPEHRRWLELGNSFVAYCEQAEAAAPAFRPRGASPQTRESVGDAGAMASTLPGETSRDEIMALITSSVRLPLRRVTWTLDEYAKTVLREPRYYETLNWGHFSHRYLPILDSFRLANEAGPSAIWPLPSPDPLSNGDATSCGALSQAEV